MAKVYVSEVEKLKAELKEKTSYMENLQKSHDDQAHEIKEAKILCETYEERLKTLEDENRSLVLALEEAKRETSCSSSIPTTAENEDGKFQKLLQENIMNKKIQVTSWQKEQIENEQKEEETNLEKLEGISDNANNEDLELETCTLHADISSPKIKWHSQTKTLEQLERESHMSKQLEIQLSEYKVLEFTEPNRETSIDSSMVEELKLENEEFSVINVVLQQAISEAQAIDNDGNEESELEMYKKRLEKAYSVLDKAVNELDELIYEGNRLECEVLALQLACERLTNDLEESHTKRKELEASLISQVVFGERLMEERRKKNEQQVEESEKERVRFMGIIEEKDKILKVLHMEIQWLQKEAFKKDSDSAVVVKNYSESETNESVKDSYMHLMNERRIRMDDIVQQLTSLEEQFSKSYLHYEDEDEGVPESEAEVVLQILKNKNKRLMDKAHSLLMERENLLDYFQDLGTRVCEFSTVDSELMDIVGSMVETLEDRDDDYDDNESMLSENMIELPETSGANNLEAISI